MPDKPKIEPPWDDYVKLVAKQGGRDGALSVLQELRLPERLNGLDGRVRTLEITRAWILGALIGSGAIGGTVASVVARMF